MATAERLAPAIFRAMAAAGTTTFLGYGAIWADSLDATFRAAEAHGIRAVIGKVMMDRLTYDDALPRDRILETSLRQSADLCERWHGAAEGRLRYAFTPRFAVACTADLLRESAALANHFRRDWQTHLSEDKGEIAAVRDLFPDAATTSTSTTEPAVSARAASSPTPSTARTASSTAWSAAAPTSPTARSRTCSCPAASCPSRGTSQPA